jgi:hypothetical protein
MDVTTAIHSYPHVTEYRRTSSISSQDNKQHQQESPISESYCSCCCSSFEEEGHNSSSTICTTPNDTTAALSPTCEDNEKSRGKKVHAIEELLQTERDYVQDLSHLVEVIFIYLLLSLLSLFLLFLDCFYYLLNFFFYIFAHINWLANKSIVHTYIN